MAKSKHWCYSRESKLQVLKYMNYHENGRNKYQMCQKFCIAKGLPLPMYQDWEADFRWNWSKRRKDCFGLMWKKSLLLSSLRFRRRGLKSSTTGFILEQCNWWASYIRRSTSDFLLAGSTASRWEITFLIGSLLTKCSPKYTSWHGRQGSRISLGDQTSCSIERFRCILG